MILVDNNHAKYYTTLIFQLIVIPQCLYQGLQPQTSRAHRFNTPGSNE